MPRRLIAAISLTIMVGVAGALLAVTVSDAGVVWPYFLLAGATGVASAIGWPASQALTPEVVPVDLVPNAVALRSVASTTAVITGPAVGGLLFAWKPEAVYALAAFLFAVAAVCMTALRVPRRARDEDEAVGLDALVEGLRFVWRTKMLLGAITLDLFAVLFGGGIALLPIYARDILHVGPVGLGILRAAPAVGAFAAALLRRPPPAALAGRPDADHGRHPLRRAARRLGRVRVDRRSRSPRSPSPASST